MSQSTISQVTEFNLAFGFPIHTRPHLEDESKNTLRLNLIEEELSELKAALAKRDAVATLDALVDLQYVLDGAFLALGFHHVKDAAFAEVHRSNMTKLGDEGKPLKREDGKLLKGDRYEPPQLEQFVS